MSSNLEKEFYDDAAHDIQQVLNEFQELSWKGAIQEMVSESGEFNLKIQVLDDQGQTIFLTPGVKEWDWPIDKQLLAKASHEPVWTNENINGESHIVEMIPLVFGNRPPHVFRAAKSRSDINRIKNHLIYCINIGTPLVLIVALVVGRFLSKKALEPVDRIRERAQTINSDNLDERLVYDGPPNKLHLLTNTLNNLFKRIQRTITQIKRFIADTSHELRIPLTGLQKNN
jgi:methyl-accepting chemotaxis protein